MQLHDQQSKLQRAERKVVEAAAAIAALGTTAIMFDKAHQTAAAKDALAGIEALTHQLAASLDLAHAELQTIAVAAGDHFATGGSKPKAAAMVLRAFGG